MKTWRDLLNEYLIGDLDPSDLEAFLEGASGHEPEIQAVIGEMLAKNSAGGLGTEAQRVRLLHEITSKRQEASEIPEEAGEIPEEVSEMPSAPRIPFLRRWGWVAAAVVLLVAGGVYLWLRDNHPQPLISDRKALPTDIEPGYQGAILTLADGKQLVLDSLANGVIGAQGGATLVLQNGQLAYDPAGGTGTGEVYNTMTTPKGRLFNLLLPDGTRVWLNAASSIRYPTRFSGTERKIAITGEAYLEVKQQAGRPFKVQINDRAEVEVLGTSFNINAYENEATINTTLLEGSIKLTRINYSRGDQQGGETIHQQGGEAIHQRGGKAIRQQGGNVVHQQSDAAILTPGQQAQIENLLPLQNTAGKKIPPGIKIINNADTEKVLAWKNGAFDFQDLGLQEVMRQLERWYDIEVEYEGPVPDIYFIGKMSRDLKLSELLKLLKDSEVDFRIEAGRKLVILP